MKVQQSSAPGGYRPDIDGLRAIAVISVVIFHAFPYTLPGGFVGVDIFFVISGFLITSIILSKLKGNSFSFVEFYTRRILRLFPALISVLAACLAIGWFVLLQDEYFKLGTQVTAGALFISNFLMFAETGYFDVYSGLKPLLHLWSLGVEEQFYIFWPLFCYVIIRTKLIYSFAIKIFISFSFLLCVIVTYISRDLAFYFPLTRFWELAIGAFIADSALRHRPSVGLKTAHCAQRLPDAIAFAGIALIVWSLFSIKTKFSFPGFWALSPVIGAAMIISAGPSAWLNRVVMSNRALVFIGLISYPLYLWHWPLLALVRICEGTFREAPLQSRLFALVLSTGLACATFMWIERPLRFSIFKRRNAAALLAAMCLTAVAGGTIVWQQGIPSRVQMIPASAQVLVEPYPHPQKNGNCIDHYPHFRNAWSCLLSEPKDADVIIFGDSHAHQYYRSLAKALNGKSVLNISAPGCLPFTSNSKCKRIIDSIIEFIINNHSIKTIYMTGYFSFLASGFESGNVEGRRVAKFLTDEERKRFQDSAAAVISSLTKLNKEVFIIIDIPDAIVKPISCIHTSSRIMNMVRFPGARSDQASGDCAIDEAAFRRRIAPFDTALMDVLKEFPQIKVLDPRPHLCDGKQCWIIRDGVPLYWNSDHLTVEGADLVIGKIVRTSKQQERGVNPAQDNLPR